jgi:hypothetical protein
MKQGHRQSTRLFVSVWKSRFRKVETSLRQNDLPIAAGQKHTFKIAEWLAQEWEEQSKRERRPEPKLLSLQFQDLNFGDATGFNTTAAGAIRHKSEGLSKTLTHECLPVDLAGACGSKR